MTGVDLGSIVDACAAIGGLCNAAVALVEWRRRRQRARVMRESEAVH